jgi:non-specific serine/threonine protein kinase
LSKFASEARSHHPPGVQRHQLDTLLAAFDDAARQYRSAQAALSSGKTKAYHTALNQADRTMQTASLTAQRYGMPPLADCAKEQGGSQQSPAPVQLAGRWRLGHESPFVVQYAPAAELGGQIWVAGGLLGPKYATAKTEFYDPTIDTWNPGPPLPIALHHAMMVTYHSRLWVIGGFVAEGGNVLAAASARVLILNKTHTGWINGPALHHARAAGAAAVVGHKIVVVGGRTGASQQLVKPTEIFDGTSWHDAAAIPVPGNHLAAASDGTYLYAVGGHKITETSNTAAVQRFDPGTGQWTQLPPMPAAASGLGAAIVGGQLITVGGDNATTVFNTVRTYNLATKAWSTLAHLPAARTGMSVTAYRNILYAVDGAAQPGHIASKSTVQILTLPRAQSPAPVQLAGRWRLGHESPFVVQYAPAAELGGQIWVAGGLLGPKYATAKTEFYDPTIDTWNPGPPLPIALHHAMMVTYHSRLWVIGGFVAEGGNVLAAASARVLILNKTHTGWINGPALHHARAAGAAAVVGHKIVVVGGRTGASQQLVKPTEIFDGTSWHDAAAIPVPGNHLAAASDGTYLYAVGGHKITETSNTAAVQRFDPGTGQWTQLPPMPAAASGLGAAIVGGQLITVGGDNATTVFNTVRTYNLATKAWSTLAHLPAARTGMSVTAYRNILYAVDGAAQPGHIASKSTVQILRFHR